VEIQWKVPKNISDDAVKWYYLNTDFLLLIYCQYTD